MKTKVIRGWVPGGESETRTARLAALAAMYTTKRAATEDGNSPDARRCKITITVEHQ